MNSESHYAYYEPTEALNIRIKAHKLYSQFSLESYLTKNFSFVKRNVLDVGCGNGNLTGILSAKATIYFGIEKNNESLIEAYDKYSTSKNIIFLNRDMDADFFFPRHFFDYIFLIFSSYYTNDADFLFKNCHRIMKKNGNLVIIGPTINNAKEVDDFCYQMFQKEKPSQQRSQRIEKEFYPLLSSMGFNTSVNFINFNLKFPDAEEYLRYILSTLQYRESYNGNLDKGKALSLITENYELTLTKEVVVLCAKK